MTAVKPITLGRAWDLLDACVPSIATACPEIKTVEPAGDIRRVEALVSSIVLVASADDPAAAIDILSAARTLAPVSAPSGRQIVCTFRNTPIEILIAAPEEHGSALFQTTGSDAHLTEMEPRGWRDRLHASEQALYSSLGLAFIPPELRHGRGETDAAAAGDLPQLIDTPHIRGDLHMHTTYSDGRDDIASMIGGCHALG